MTTWKKLTGEMRRELEALCTGKPTKRMKSDRFTPSETLEELRKHGLAWMRNGEWRVTDAGRVMWQSRQGGALSCMETDCDERADGTGLFCLKHRFMKNDPEKMAPRTNWPRNNRPDRFDYDEVNREA